MLRILVGLLLITLVAAGAGSCKRGTRVSAGDGCNTCTCSDHRILVNCTVRDCNAVQHKQRLHRRLHKREVPEEKKKVCTPGKPYIPDGDCNYCLCSEDGKNTHACTKLLFCEEPRSVKDEPCSHNDEFKSVDGCNDCRCDRHNFARCTKKKCPP
uniref:Protease inhibitor n=1 Tax=Panstrongylus lignarius TaxID=156445 RepID=A0A224XRT5_9HEMI